MGPCDICGQQPQQMQIGNMETGQQLFVCAACFARWSLDFAKAILPPEEIAGQLGPMFVAPARAEALGKESKRRGRKAKEAEAEAEAAEGTAGGADEMAPAAADQ